MQITKITKADAVQRLKTLTGVTVASFMFDLTGSVRTAESGGWQIVVARYAGIAAVGVYHGAHADIVDRFNVEG